MYKVVICPNCSTMNITSSKTLKCIKCGKTKLMSYLKVYFQSYNSKECQLFMSEYKKESAINSGKYNEGFE